MPAPDTTKVDVYMQFYVGDYLKDTAHLSCEEHGAYSLLIFYMWGQGGSLPADHDRLARLARIERDRWPGIWAAIGEYFLPAGPGRITQKRLAAELDKARRRKVDAADNGRKGAGKRWGKALADPEPPDGEAMATPIATPLATPLANRWRDDDSSITSLKAPSPAPDPGPVPARADPGETRARAIPDVVADAWPEQEPEPVRVHQAVVRVRRAIDPNPAHGPAPPDGGLDPSGIRPRSPPARDPPQHRAYRLLGVFCRVRAELARARGQPEVIEWTYDEAAIDKALAFVRQVSSDRAACLDVEPTMRLRLADAWDSQDPRDDDPGWVFATWISRFTALRARVKGTARSADGPTARQRKAIEDDRRRAQASLGQANEYLRQLAQWKATAEPWPQEEVR